MTVSASNEEQMYDATADVTSFLGYLVRQEGGEVRINIPEFESAEPEDKFLTFDVEDEELVIRLVDASEVPAELGGKKVD